VESAAELQEEEAQGKQWEQLRVISMQEVRLAYPATHQPGLQQSRANSCAVPQLVACRRFAHPPTPPPPGCRAA
jgi:hypothetical protein